LCNSRLALAFLIACLTTSHSFSQQVESCSVPRTEHGHPDFHGVWILKFLTPLERPTGVQNLIITAEQARELTTASQFQLREVTDPDEYINGANSYGLVEGEYRNGSSMAGPLIVFMLLKNGTDKMVISDDG
jgi:hypothetical protein